jgi:chromate transporter
MFLPGATGAALLVHVREWMARARWSRALRRALVPIGMGLSFSVLLTLIQMGLDSLGSLLLVGLSAFLIYRGKGILPVLLAGAVLGLLLPGV